MNVQRRVFVVVNTINLFSAVNSDDLPTRKGGREGQNIELVLKRRLGCVLWERIMSNKVFGGRKGCLMVSLEWKRWLHKINEYIQFQRTLKTGCVHNNDTKTSFYLPKYVSGWWYIVASMVGDHIPFLPDNTGFRTGRRIRILYISSITIRFDIIVVLWSIVVASTTSVLIDGVALFPQHSCCAINI